MSELRKRSVSLSHSQVSSLETMLSSVCEVTSWLDWWLSACGSFREHLTDEACGNFEQLMLSGSRALQLLGSQGVTALGNLVLSRRDLLLLDVKSTVPAEEVSRLRYAALPLSTGLIPTPLLESALDKMRVASNDGLFLFHFPAELEAEGTTTRVRLPFRLSPAAPAAPVANVVVPGRSPPDGVSRSLRVGGCLSAHWRHWQAIGAESWVLSVLRDGYRINSHPLPGLSSFSRSHPDIVSDVSVRISSITGSGP